MFFKLATGRVKMTTKIGKVQPKIGFIYPEIRLPRSEVAIVGATAEIWRTDVGGYVAYLVVTDMKESRMWSERV